MLQWTSSGDHAKNPVARGSYGEGAWTFWKREASNLQVLRKLSRLLKQRRFRRRYSGRRFILNT
jgi:hypothetical protein